jgi:hypothetical protein
MIKLTILLFSCVILTASCSLTKVPVKNVGAVTGNKKVLGIEADVLDRKVGAGVWIDLPGAE